MRQHLLENGGVNTGTFPAASKGVAEEEEQEQQEEGKGQEWLQGK